MQTPWFGAGVGMNSAATQLRTAGYKNVSELRGGFAAWEAAGYPIKGKSSVV